MWHNNELERAKRSFRAIGAAGAQVPYKHKAGGSNPSSPTINSKTSSDGGLFVPGEVSLDLNPARAKRPSGPFVVEQAEGRRRPANPRSGCAQIPHRPPLTQRPPATGVFSFPGKIPLI